MYIPTQDDINLMKQKSNKVFVDVQVLDMNFKTIGIVSGEITDESSSIDVDSDIRKSISLGFVVKNNTLNIGADKKLWINRYIRVIYKKEKLLTGQYLEYDRGIYVLKDYSVKYSATEYSMSLECADLVCLYNGDIKGNLKGLQTKIYRDELIDTDGEIPTVRKAMLKVMDLAGITKYNIGNMSKEFPYDLEFSSSQTLWDMIVEIRDLYPGWETFFDLDGTFVCQPIPTCETDIVVLDSHFWEPLVIDESISCDLFAVKNATKVWGKCLECDYYADSVTYSDGVYIANFSALPIEDSGKMSTSIKLAIDIPMVNADNPTVVIKNTVSGTTSTIGTYNIVNDSEENIKANTLSANTTYVFRYRREKLFLMGQWQIVAVCYLVADEPSDTIKEEDIAREGTDRMIYTVNPDSPFCREYIGERMKVFSGGNCDNIYSEQLAFERAEYENWQSARTTYSLSLNTVYVPFLYGNEKIQYRLKSTNEVKEWIVKKISGSWLSGTMSITLAEFYPLYPFIVKS